MVLLMDYLEIMLSIDQSQFLAGVKFQETDVTVVDFKKGDIIYDEINNIPAIALIHSGEVNVLLDNDDKKSTVVNTLKAGSCFGISNLLFHHKLDTNLKCKTDTTIIYIPKEIVRAEMAKDAKLAMRYGAFCNEKINFLIKKLEFFTLQSAREKLIAFLMENKDENGIVPLESTKENLAASINISRAGLYRELSRLQHLGAVNLNKTDIHIKDEALLCGAIK